MLPLLLRQHEPQTLGLLAVLRRGAQHRAQLLVGAVFLLELGGIPPQLRFGGVGEQQLGEDGASGVNVALLLKLHTQHNETIQLPAS